MYQRGLHSSQRGMCVQQRNGKLQRLLQNRFLCKLNACRDTSLLEYLKRMTDSFNSIQGDAPADYRLDFDRCNFKYQKLPIDEDSIN